MIELIGLSKSYHGHQVLSDLHLSVHPGEIFGIIGKSGAGKSTLLRCINLLERPDSGKIRIRGDDILELSPAKLRALRHDISMVFQHFNLLESKTVFDNIALPMRIQNMDETIIAQKINELLDFVELGDKAHYYPRALSGGQKQRVAIARALSTSPKILLCDEATSALDPETTQAILALLKKINAHFGITIVLITHEMEVIKAICHRVAVMSQGVIEEVLSLSDVFSHPESIAKRLLYAHLSPKLPACLLKNLSSIPNDKPLLRLCFEGKAATGPFISQTSRELDLDINILLANIDRIESITCGIIIIEIHANEALLQTFIERCEQHHLTVEVLGYVTELI
jgi:D-methionine transport system ATP-binding protein